MRPRNVSAVGFTLVELLAVVAILTLLIMMLMPMLNHAIAIAQRAQCMSNYREVGAAFHGFAAAHNQRGTNCVYLFNTPDPNLWITQDTLPNGQWNPWMMQGYSEGCLSMLESEYFHSNVGAGGLPRISHYMPSYATPHGPVTEYNCSADLVTRRRMLACPSAQVPSTTYARENMVYVDFIGGEWGSPGDSDAACPLEGPYGVKVIPPPVVWPSQANNYTVYCLGPRYEQYPNPSGQFAMWECEWATDETDQIGYEVPNDPSETSCLMQNSLGHYISHYGQYAYRHPNMTCVFLFVDGHVEYLSPSDRIMGADRYCYIRTW